MTLDPAAGSMPSHLTRDGVKCMLGLFESRNGVAISTESLTSGTDSKSSKQIGVGEDTAHHATPSPHVTLSHSAATCNLQGSNASSGDASRAGGGASEFELDMEDTMATSDRNLVMAEKQQQQQARATAHEDTPPFDARGRWARATQLSVLVARACLPRRRRGASVGCLRVLRSMVAAVAGGVDMTTEEACMQIIKPMCTAAGGTFNNVNICSTFFHFVSLACSVIHQRFRLTVFHIFNDFNGGLCTAMFAAFHR